MSVARPGKALRERVEEAPFDDAPRLVYMDHLLEKRDPRGEFIELSFLQERRELEARETKKLAAKVHERSWCGPILDVTASRTYARGFLETCHLDPRSASRYVNAARGHRAWSTVRTLALAYADWGASFVGDACMGGLRRVEALS